MCGLDIASNVCLINVSLKLKTYKIHLLIFSLYARVVSFPTYVAYPEGSGAVDILW